jgi:hypothetical protein
MDLAGELTIDNFNGFVNKLIKKHSLEGSNYYGKAMKMIRQHYFGSASKRNKPLSNDVPIYVMFVTDGATFDEQETIHHIQSSSFEPLFWQFMAMGNLTKGLKSGDSFEHFNPIFHS